LSAARFQDPPGLHAELDRLARLALVVGGVALGACVLGALLGAEHFFRSYLLAVVFWSGIPLGGLAVLALQHLTGGAWGLVIRRPLESATRTLPFLALLFLPLFLGLHQLYEWTHVEAVARDPVLSHKSAYLNVPFQALRLALYFGAWIAVAHYLNKWSLEQDRTGDERITRKFQLLSSGALVLYALTVTFWSVDWVMSIEPHWFSTIYGVLFMIGQALAALAFVVAVLVLLARRPPLSEIVAPGHYHDLGKLLLAFVMLWAYVNFSQFLIVWSGNLPEEVPWYLARLRGGWGIVALALVLFHFSLPFVLLLSRGTKRNPRALATVAGLIVAMRFVDALWLILPAFSRADFRLHWMDLAAPIGVGGLWIAVFAHHLKTRAILPFNDPRFAEAVERRHE
jgi:hypothetical protein